MYPWMATFDYIRRPELTYIQAYYRFIATRAVWYSHRSLISFSHFQTNRQLPLHTFIWLAIDMKAVLYLILSSCLTCSFSARLPANVNNSEEACVWSPWLDRDDPSGHCDCEHTSSLFSEGFPGTCQHPIRVEARRKSDRKPVQDLDTEFSFRFFDERGLDCRNADQEGGKRCDDFELRMCCDTHQGKLFIFKHDFDM